MTIPSLRRTVALTLCAAGLNVFTCSGQTVAASDSAIPYKQIGKVTPRSAREIQSSDWSIGCETLDRDLADYSKYKQYLGPLGAKAVRLQGGWAKTEKKPGVYDWKWLDEIIDDALSQGVQPWVELSYGNRIYEGGGGPTLGDGAPRSETALKAWDAWAKAMVQRYKNRISHWEIWNEPDITKEVAVEGYVDLYIRTAEMIRAEQPEAKLYALGLAGNAEFAKAFLEAMAAQGKLGLVDAITFHGYPQIPDSLGTYNKIKEVVDKFPAKIELRQGETGAPSTATAGALRRYTWTELSQTKWDLRRMLVHHGAGVPMNLFTLSEFIYNDSRRKGRNTKGLLSINEDKSVAYAKPAYFAVQNVFSIFDHTVVREKGFDISSNAGRSIAVYGYRKQPSNLSVITVWFKGEPVAETNDFKPVDFTFKKAKFEYPVYVDLRTGAVFEIPESAWTQKGDEVKFRAIPIYDCPVVLADKSALLFK